ncbi:transposase [Chryseobacterium sp. RP-3-3]|uniref:Transposase n=1 Tax=Chryseobacterium antibioticum TaxID=2728847 RepID=A0A7Y0AKV0_9FLAO|nr:transposase [Chryseobacterium antibioticum]NML69047.1 transposase [Chryseobacterium antibioticum]
METNFKEIHIGNYIREHVKKHEIPLLRICNFLKTTEEEIIKMYEQESLDTNVLLKWSKLLEYDFFRFYSQHLILYAPPSSARYNKTAINKNDQLPQFRKNIYTIEIIDFILGQIKTGEKTKLEIIEQYKIPKTTLYKWINKFTNRSI